MTAPGLPDIPNDVATMLAAARGMKADPVRRTMIEQILSDLERTSAGTAQLAAAVLAAGGDREVRKIANGFIERVGEMAGKVADASEPPIVDLLVVTVKPIELRACLAAFDVPAGAPSVPLDRTGLCGWPKVVDNHRVVVTMVGTAGNVQSAVLMASLDQVMRPRCAVLVGMAGGLKKKVDEGDVVVADSVVEYEFQRLTPDGPRYFPNTYTPIRGPLHDAEITDLNDPGFPDRCAQIVRAADPEFVPEKWAKDHLGAWRPKVKRGVVLAGAKLLEDGSLPKLRDALHDKVIAVEMEGAGFGYACKESRIEWQVIRGIADHGMPGRSKEWQFAATAAAAVFVRESLRRGRFSLAT
jgi:nucleoside phosphorylase